MHLARIGAALFDLHFLEMRRSILDSSAFIELIIDKGNYYMGRELKLSVDYALMKHFSIGLDAGFKYLMTSKRPLSVYDEESQTWITNQLVL